MKWLGALLLIISTTGIGLFRASTLDKRPNQIRQLIQSLQLLEAEITYSQLPLLDAFQRISRQIPQPLQSFYKQLTEEMKINKKDFVNVWSTCVEELQGKSSLNKAEIEVLKQFGASLGQHDFIQQQKHIQLTLTHLERELNEAYEEQNKYAKLSKSLGVLSGIFIALLLI